MLPSAPSFERLALNRVTFGACEADMSAVRERGWIAWVADQLRPPAGDEDAVAAHLKPQTLRIKYAVQLPAGSSPGWPAVDERRRFNYLGADISTIWKMVSQTEISIAPNERARIQQELNAATWIRNTHARYQLREFMADFWNNHFNVGRQEDVYASAALAVYDAEVIRPRVFGNFRDLLEAVATSAAMLRYLNNAASGSAMPTENYARELLELHTLGQGAYLGVNAAVPRNVFIDGEEVAAGFTDADVIQAARALSGWTIAHGQAGEAGVLPFTGKFVYNPAQHNGTAGFFMGVDLAPLTLPMAQGRRVLDIVSAHPATATYICTKLGRRIFGDRPPQSVIERAVAVWMTNQRAPDQIARVLSTILLDDEIGRSAAKLRRPYEKIIALYRATGTTVNAYDGAYDALASLGDGLYAWPTPEGRPDSDTAWLAASANLKFWNLMFDTLGHPSFRTTLADQTPASASASPESIVAHWVSRLVGSALRPESMAALIQDVQGPIGVMAAYRSGGIAHIENALRRLVVLIATAPEFAMR
jgi:uncharacterized protein (DUF1800 family)